MKKLCILLLVFGSGLFAACGNEESGKDGNTERKTMTTDKPMLDESLVGTYIGQLPCATCEAMQTSIILREDNSYAISTKAVNDTNLIVPAVDNGTFVIRNEILELTDAGGERTMYRISKDQLCQLGEDGTQLTGNGKQDYIFKKQH